MKTGKHTDLWWESMRCKTSWVIKNYLGNAAVPRYAWKDMHGKD